MKKKVLLTSVVTIILCLCLIAGSTYALFTSSTSASMVVQSATVKVNAVVENLQVYSLTDDATKKDQNGWIFEQCSVVNNQGSFINGGTVKLDGNNLELNYMSPGDKVTFTIAVTNSSNIATQCKVIITEIGDLDDGQNGLKVTYTPHGNITSLDGNWFAMAANDTTGSITVTVELPVEAGNEYQNKTFNMTVLIEAIQSNGAGTPVDQNGVPTP